MKVLLINTSECTGGAAIAASRLMHALRACGIEASLLVAQRQTDHPYVIQAAPRWRYRLSLLWDRLLVYVHNRFSLNGLWAIDTAEAGLDITQLRSFVQADVIHLHWINQGFLSSKTLGKIMHSGKRVVWTMHDMWPFTGICHHAADCSGYRKHCGHCFRLRYGGVGDVSNRVLHTKGRLLEDTQVSFVACSHWLEELARSSTLLRNRHICCIPNPLDTSVFYPGSRFDARKRLGLPLQASLVLFACMKVTDKMKGIDYLVEAARHLQEKYGEQLSQLAFIVIGKHSEALAQQLRFPVYDLGFVSDPKRIADIYRAADVFVIPSLHENLPNTIAEAMACGTPCVGFRVGGIPEMIDHEANGYIADYKDAISLCEGIVYVLSHPLLGQAAQHYARYQYAEERVAQRYLELYRASGSAD